MIVIRLIVKFILWLRYRVTVTGAKTISQNKLNGKGMLFLPNHPGLIDPLILLAHLHGEFGVRPVADENQVKRPVIEHLANGVRVIPLPDATQGGNSADRIAEAMSRITDALAQGDNVLMYPAGHICRSRHENLGGNSGVEYIVKALPDVRVILVKTRGLWGSQFGWGQGGIKNLPTLVRHGFKSILKNGVFFGPRRDVSVALHEADDFPRMGDRHEINKYLENFYNADAPPNTYVPYTLWEGGGVQVVPEPERAVISGDLSQLTETARAQVTAYLTDLCGRKNLKDEDDLAKDLGLDSLSRAEIILWIAQEFGFSAGDTDSMNTVRDCLLAACGQAVASDRTALTPVPSQWRMRDKEAGAAEIPAGDDLVSVFLSRVAKTPSQAAIADQKSGVRSYREILRGALALQPKIAALAGDGVGIMLPASVGGTIVYWATLFAGKTPVMVNWTAGERNLQHAMDTAGVKHILTAKALVGMLAGQGTRFGELESRFVYLETLGSSLGIVDKLSALVKSYFPSSLAKPAKLSPTAAILFTSGSESFPKAVPLSHQNLLTNLRDVLSGLSLDNKDAFLGMLPPFHSFGLTGATLLPVLSGVRVVFHANPTEGPLLGRLIELYRVSVALGTPTFLNGIVRASGAKHLSTLRLGFSGAEKCPASVYELLAEKCPSMVLVEGYGITECSPVVSFNDPKDARAFTIGKIVKSLKYAIVDVDKMIPVEQGQSGMLLVRGPSIFSGYLGGEASRPFVDYDGQSWYKTGDLVKEDGDGVLHFAGRLKRFIKLGGEMISLPAIESVLDKHFPVTDDGPAIAVESTPDEDKPELVLFATSEIDRETVNGYIREGGLSPLHNIRRIENIDAIPVLGTGKTNYRELKERLK